MSEREDYLRSVKITNTPIGQEYQWDTLAEVNYDMLRHNLEAKFRVMGNPQRFPKADRAALDQQIIDHQDFLVMYPQV